MYTWVQCTPNRHVNSDAKLYGGNRAQDDRNPLTLPHYRVSSMMVRVGKGIGIDDGRLYLRARTIWADRVTSV